MNKNTKVSNGPGRPRYEPIIPKTKFTFRRFEEINGVKPNGRGPNCTRLTLRKFMDKDMYYHNKKGHRAQLNPKSKIVLLDMQLPADSKTGKGRKQLVYCLRELASNIKLPKTTSAPAKDVKTSEVAKVTRKVRTPKLTTVDVSTSTSEYEAKKAELLAPTPVVEISTPSVEVAPVVETPVTQEVNAETVAETIPAPVETATETANG